MPLSDTLTIMIAARDAAATIERAVRSCLGETSTPILLVDDHCTDHTVAIARRVAGDRLRVIPAPDPGGIPVARQAGLDAVETPFATWLDADDEWVPGRAQRMTRALESGHDVAVDAFDLYDGTSGARLRRLAAPAFLQRPRGAVRLFERNFLPGDSPVGFRVDRFRDAGGYDAAIYGPESYDLLLRAIARGARFTWSDEVGYRIYAYPGSVSRNLARQRAALAMALRKHTYESVRALYVDAGHPRRVAAWALVSMAMFRFDAAAAVQFIDEASPAAADPLEVLEGDGPWPFAEGWRRAFGRGTALLVAGNHDAEALSELLRAESLDPTPEGANNLGVALARAGRRDDAMAAFAQAECRFPGYADARQNAAAAEPSHITTHPLRRLSSRNDYA
jgi:glycosyltransferase involved in cell wall biosynthesis